MSSRRDLAYEKFVVDHVAKIGKEQEDSLASIQSLSQNSTQPIVEVGVADLSFYQIHHLSKREREEQNFPITENYQSDVLDKLENVAQSVNEILLNHNYLEGDSLFVTSKYDEKICPRLKSLKKLVLHNNDFSSANFLGSLSGVPLEEIVLSHNNLVSFVVLNQTLINLSLDYNRLSTFTICSHDNIQELDLSHNKLTTFSIMHDLLDQRLPSLRILKLIGNELTGALSSQSQSLRQLEELHLDQNHLTHIGDDLINNLTNLRHFSASYNQLDSSPNIFDSKFTKLSTVLLNNNKIHQLPNHVNGSPPIQTLMLNNNELEWIPEWINQLAPTLVDITLQSNKLTTLPKTFGELTLLTTLYLFKNELTHLPDEICNLINLTEFDVFENKLKKLPDNIGNFTKLSRLCVDDNDLTTIPNSLMNCDQLYLFSYQGNNNLRVPAFLSKMHK
ncbi:hypothetical protein AKO1_014384 [Acrasis kona]|uniref:Uncharacterized protein n=1 Tax=Acrasis kona TaxID=1008807 RepID=A0AAW2Z181_9EUKA